MGHAYFFIVPTTLLGLYTRSGHFESILINETSTYFEILEWENSLTDSLVKDSNNIIMGLSIWVKGRAIQF